MADSTMCKRCSLTRLVMFFATLAAIVALFVMGHEDAGGWMIAVLFVQLLFLTCRYACFTPEEWRKWKEIP